MLILEETGEERGKEKWSSCRFSEDLPNQQLDWLLWAIAPCFDCTNFDKSSPICLTAPHAHSRFPVTPMRHVMEQSTSSSPTVEGPRRLRRILIDCIKHQRILDGIKTGRRKILKKHKRARYPHYMSRLY